MDVLVGKGKGQEISSAISRAPQTTSWRLPLRISDSCEREHETMPICRKRNSLRVPSPFLHRAGQT
jgi:hypothetical protein